MMDKILTPPYKTMSDTEVRDEILDAHTRTSKFVLECISKILMIPSYMISHIVTEVDGKIIYTYNIDDFKVSYEVEYVCGEMILKNTDTRMGEI